MTLDGYDFYIIYKTFSRIKEAVDNAISNINSFHIKIHNDILLKATDKELESAIKSECEKIDCPYMPEMPNTIKQGDLDSAGFKEIIVLKYGNEKIVTTRKWYQSDLKAFKDQIIRNICEEEAQKSNNQ